MDTKGSSMRELVDEANRTNQWLEMIEENTRSIKSTLNIIFGIMLFCIIFSIIAGLVTFLFSESLTQSIVGM